MHVLRRSALAVVLALLVALAPLAAEAGSRPPVEDYASYQPQTKCRPNAKAGTKALARWLERRYDGTSVGGLERPCDVGGASEHKDGRAIDWSVDARSKQDRIAVADFLERVFAADRKGNPHAKARRMGIMYVIWNDHIYASYDRFAKRDYLSSSCEKRRTCSATLRHRDHVHISLSRAGAKGRTSWYAGRVG